MPGRWGGQVLQKTGHHPNGQQVKAGIGQTQACLISLQQKALLQSLWADCWNPKASDSSQGMRDRHRKVSSLPGSACPLCAWEGRRDHPWSRWSLGLGPSWDLGTPFSAAFFPDGRTHTGAENGAQALLLPGSSPCFLSSPCSGVSVERLKRWGHK